MKFFLRLFLVLVTLGMASVGEASDDTYSKAVRVFKEAGQSEAYFSKSYGYALFPTVGKGGFVIGGARGTGRVYAGGDYVGDASMTQLSVGLQAGGQAFSEIIFFQDKRAFTDFTSGNFEFSAQIAAVAITAGAGASAGTTGNSAGASASDSAATNVAHGWTKGMAVFTVAKGGLMYEATVGGQKFSYTPRK
jgi:lipid-binding SYLF domain-containing protein